MSGKLKVAVGGINGRLGRATARLLAESDSFELAGVFGRAGAHYIGMDLGQLLGLPSSGHSVSGSLEELIESGKPDIVFENSEAANTVSVAQFCLAKGIKFVSGTSGLADADVEKLSELSARSKTGILLIPNFSIGAVLMMEFARQAGAFFENVEIVEMHHTKKLDAPSGTAMHTLKKLASVKSEYNKKEIDDHELLKGSRGASGAAGVRVHSLRLPGLISHQEVIFGAAGELLTVRHDSFNMDCFLKGIILSLEYVSKIDHLVLGLDRVLGFATDQKKSELASC